MELVDWELPDEGRDCGSLIENLGLGGLDRGDMRGLTSGVRGMRGLLPNADVNSFCLRLDCEMMGGGDVVAGARVRLRPVSSLTSSDASWSIGS